MTSTADVAATPSNVANQLIDGPIDAVLSEFRELQVWDEHARRLQTPKLFRVTYRPINQLGFLEINSGQNERLDPADYTVGYSTGEVTITPDTGAEDYFITYAMNLFPANDLYQLMNLTLQEINAFVPEGSKQITKYSSIDTLPSIYYPALVYGTLAKCFSKLGYNSGLWKNRLIWADGQAGADLANNYAGSYRDLFTQSASGPKKQAYLALPTTNYTIFEMQGMGNFVATGSSKFRGFRPNRMASF